MTLHPDELTDGYRRRIRKSGKCPDKSKVIEKISQQQEKRGKMKSRAKACFKHSLLSQLTRRTRTVYHGQCVKGNRLSLTVMLVTS